MEFVYRRLLVVFSVIAGGAATAYNDPECIKISTCLTPEIRKYHMDPKLFCPLWPPYMDCIHKYKPYCRPERAKNLESTLKLYDEKGKSCQEVSASRREVSLAQCTQIFSGCLTHDFKALKEKRDNNEDRCRKAPQVIGCFEDALDQCRDMAPEHLRMMRDQVENWKTDIRCNAGSQLAFSISQISFGVLILLIRWLHHY